jgi:peptide/nickel transport system substrate-binding protein
MRGEEAQEVKLWRKSALIAPAVIVAMTAAACGGSNDSGGGGDTSGTAKGGQLVFGFEGAFPDNLLPVISAGNSTATGFIEPRVLLTPFYNKPDFTLAPDPDLIVGEPTSTLTNGKQVIVYHVNPKAVWSDGDPIDAKDFDFSWQLQKSTDPAKGGCADVISTVGFDQIASVEGSDNDKTVTVTMAKPFADWKGLWGGPSLLPQHIMDKGSVKANCDNLTKGWPSAGGIPVASGPYQIAGADVDASKKVITLTRNPKWWGTPGVLDRIIAQSIGSDPGVTVKALKNKELGLVYPQPQLDLVKNIKDLEPQVTSKTQFGLSFEHMDFNTKDFHLGQKEVRQAIAYGLNRPDLVSKTVGQFDARAQILNNRLYVNNQKEYKDNSGGLYDKQDTAKAKSLLESAGYKLGSDGIYAKEGKRLSLEMMTTQNNPLRENTIDVATQQLKPAGIEIKKYLNADIFAGKEKPRSLAGGQFQIGLFAWVATPYTSSNQSIYQTPVDAQNFGQNYSRAGDPRVDAGFTKLGSSLDPAVVTATANEVDGYLWEDMYTLPLYQKPTFIAYDSNFVNVEDNATAAGPAWNADKIARKA